MKKVIGGLALVLLGGMLAMATSSKVGVEISDADAASIRGGCPGVHTVSCGTCGGNVLCNDNKRYQGTKVSGTRYCCNNTTIGFDKEVTCTD